MQLQLCRNSVKERGVAKEGQIPRVVQTSGNCENVPITEISALRSWRSSGNSYLKYRIVRWEDLPKCSQEAARKRDISLPGGLLLHNMLYCYIYRIKGKRISQKMACCIRSPRKVLVQFNKFRISPQIISEATTEKNSRLLKSTNCSRQARHEFPFLTRKTRNSLLSDLSGITGRS